ncbi:MAG: arsenate reductase (azurin) small subunit [Gammaproteobacteria bacterium]|jgi:arsenite oxidase small subunit|nr:arsenate reductase (azurin) small subunit [Gammaproteobacteria bacterium]
MSIFSKLKDQTKDKDSAEEHGKCMLSRRNFLMYGSASLAAASTVTVTLFPGTAQAEQMKARVVGYPRKLVAKLSEMKDHQPIAFNYPDDGPNSQAMIVKMAGVQAGGGVGAARDIVAFNYLCTHQGGPLVGSYKATGEHRTLGQCPLHLSTFDLRRHGIIVSGQAYQSLPQVLLEVDGDEVYAVGMMGLIFGRNSNMSS